VLAFADPRLSETVHPFQHPQSDSLRLIKPGSCLSVWAAAGPSLLDRFDGADISLGAGMLDFGEEPAAAFPCRSVYNAQAAGSKRLSTIHRFRGLILVEYAREAAVSAIGFVTGR